MNTSEQEQMNLKEALEYIHEEHGEYFAGLGIGVAYSTLLKWIGKGKIEATKIEFGPTWMVTKEAIDDAVASRRVPGRSGRPSQKEKK